MNTIGANMSRERAACDTLVGNVSFAHVLDVWAELEQVTILLSTTLTATLAVAREQRVASVKRDKAASDEKVN